MSARVPAEYRANVVRLDATKAEGRILRDLGRRVSALYNVANYLCRQAFLNKEGVPGYDRLCRELVAHPVYRSLPSDIAQETLKKLVEAWASYWELRRKWKAGNLEQKPGLPRYRKDRRTGEYREDFVPIKCDRSYAVNVRSIEVTLPRDLRQKPRDRFHINYRGLRRFDGPLGRAEIAQDGSGRWYFRWSVKSVAAQPRTWQKAAGIDLGLRVLASLSVEGNAAAVHYSGREVLHDWDYWGRKIARHQREIAHRGRKSTKKIRHMHRLRRARLVHAWEAMAAEMVMRLKAQKVGVVYIGHPKHIRRDRTYGGPWAGRIHNFWSFALSTAIIVKHLRRARIRAEVVGERGTSSTCPQCGSTEVVRAPRTWLSCKGCDLVIHSDQAGSRNMIRQNKPGVSWDGPEAGPRTETLRWQRHQWADSANQRREATLPRAA